MSRGNGDKGAEQEESRWVVDGPIAQEFLWHLLDHRLFSGREENPAMGPGRETVRAILRDRYGNLAVCRLYAEGPKKE